MTNWVEIVALVVGPVTAVGLTLWRENVRHDRERKLNVMRQLLLTRSFAGDPAFTTAINLTPIEFGHVPKVMTAWEAFKHAANSQKVTTELIDSLIKEMMLSLGYSERAAGQVARDPYTASGLTDQRKLYEGVFKGILAIADATRLSAHAATAMAEHATGKPLPPPPKD